ncbi:MG2 domain-containing protein [Winogradskyella sp. UBA3174]|uniref:MG2 domain-containing protein n=1 Tax=Winogradskyella sp. UBA3174 TaxID=1947785 RepID=UPI0025CE3C62|nr:MG2 domain-containing protein [Winogradskyella sp. UBA3174]|tara:strand:+ start:43725 stop:46490 length:2766 start_codon:yes stop_codon:yes gene_type:complete
MQLNTNSLTVLFLLIFFTLAINAQIVNNITKPSLTNSSLAEKIYLQIDNTIYQTGETVWFKAVVSKSFDNSLSDMSGIIHVELIDFNATVIEKKILKLNQGITNGSFDLQESFKTGKYVIRAYTHWNRNFAEDFIFNHTIDVFNLKTEVLPKNPIINVAVTSSEDKVLTADIDPRVVDPRYRGKLKLYIKTGFEIDSIELRKNENNIYKLNYKLPDNAKQAKLEFKIEPSKKLFNIDFEDVYSKTVVIDEDFLDVQFFPEGGHLVNGLLSTVGLKSMDYKGLGYKISGNIKNNEGTIITTFSSNELGMCTFKIVPKAGKNYYAEIYKSDVAYTYSLPKAKVSGNVLSLVTIKDEIRLEITSSANNTSNIRITTASRGVLYHDFNLKLTEKQAVASIPKASLPDGIVKLSVFNQQNQIISERLLFNNRLDKRLDVKLTTNQEFYTQREKTSLAIKLDSLQLSNFTSISVLVLEKEKQEMSKQFKPNILAHLLLNSELKGFIEHPSSYFDAANLDSALDLEALMLTQGWRAYKYQKTKASTIYRYQPEKNLTVSGTIGEYFNPLKRPKKPLDLNMIIYDEPADIYNQEIDSSGKYRFEIGDLYKPKADVFMQVVDKNGTPINFGINMDKKWVPEVKRNEEENLVLPEQIVSTFIEKTALVNKRQQDYEVLYNTIALDEVELRNYELTPAREKSIELHGEPQIVIDGKELVEKAPDWNFGIYSVLKVKYPDLVRIIQVPRIPPYYYAKIVKSDITLVLVDNIPVYYENYKFIQDIPVEEVESMDIIIKAKDVYRYAFQIFGTSNVNFGISTVSYLNIYTKSGNGLFGITKAKGVRTDEINGFTESIAFYAPSYDTLTNQDWTLPDNRSVIHWSPNIELNAKGDYVLEFYNDDHIGEVSVIVEAISKDGKIGYIEKNYKIQKAEQ